MNNRVNGDLAVSRAFGDFVFKQNPGLSPVAQEVSCEPDVRVISRDENDNYLIFACDGVWDVYPDPKLFVHDMNDFLQEYETYEEAVSRMVDRCLEKGSKDNISIMFVPFVNAPKWVRIGFCYVGRIRSVSRRESRRKKKRS